MYNILVEGCFIGSRWHTSCQEGNISCDICGFVEALVWDMKISNYIFNLLLSAITTIHLTLASFTFISLHSAERVTLGHLPRGRKKKKLENIPMKIFISFIKF